MNKVIPIQTSEMDQSHEPELQKLQETIRELEQKNNLQHGLLKEVVAENQHLRKRVAELEEQFTAQQTCDGYNNTSSWISKIVFTLQQENRPLRSTTLIEILAKREPSLANHHNKIQYFSAFLSNAVSYNRIIKQKVMGVRGYYYLLPEWVDDQGNAQPEYRKMMI
jgi:predicted nuclease with TOPRIM domain